ncbi:hypothetical protein RND81_05G024500 [Saponaria officinalis]|uniref:RING-type domain-containing protein n=1 Tax=Saponaria officinalis TaxID=3572 RepID=A0AAW1KTR9_SAPOF
MEDGGENSEGIRDRNSASSRRYRVNLSAANLLRSPISTLLEYSGLFRPRWSSHEAESLIATSAPSPSPSVQNSSSNEGEVSIRIIGGAEGGHDRVDTANVGLNCGGASDVAVQAGGGGVSSSAGGVGVVGQEEGVSSEFLSSSGDGEVSAAGNRDAGYQRYDIQQAARWIEQVLPFSLLLLVVFIRQHLQGFFVTIWVSVFMFKSNDILRKQTALKGERRVPVLIGICILFTLHVVGVYWWFRNDDLLYPLIMLPPKEIPPFWHALFILMVNDTLVRQAAMIIKCLLLVYYKNSRGRNYRRQGQMLTLVEYLLLLYRALLPTPVWYRFFLNKEYGSLFSSLMTGLYLTFKLTSVVEKVQSFFTAIKALSRKEVHYGAYATSEQITAAGDMCAICQEKMHTPILLRCKHLFCEDCVSEWFERERTCPLCRALVKPADLKSFSDGSTSLFFQLF